MKRFKDKVLELVKKIPKGKVTTYKLIAEKLRTKAYRAVGNALNKNPFIGLIPCHRVIRSNGEIGGFRNGAKKKLQMLKI